MMTGKVFKLCCLVLGICSLLPVKAFCVESVTGQGGGMDRAFHLGMTQQELVACIGAPDRIKSEGRCFHYDTFDVSVFLDRHMQVERIYLGKNFKGTVKRTDGEDAQLKVFYRIIECPGCVIYIKKKDGGDTRLQNVFSIFGEPESTVRRTYAPSTAIQNRATVELENQVDVAVSEEISFPLEYRGHKKLFELYSRDMVMKYKYILDEEGISFYFDHNKSLYATVIYPMKKKAQLIQADVREPEAETIRLEMVHFDFDKYNIKDEYIPVLNKSITFLNEEPALFIVIQGHADAKGTNAYNQRLSERRSNAVYRYFIKNGIDSSRLKLVGFGELDPIAPNKTPRGADNPEGRAMNRRVSFKIKRPLR